MLNSASQIIGGISGIHLDPLLLAQSQDGDATGFIMVAHDAPQRSFDLLFIHGSAIIECARMTPDSRFQVDIDSVRSAFLCNRGACLLYLFLCPVHEIERFVATLHAEPCLKVHVNAISRKQIRSLIKATGCRNGIIERNLFETNPPRIELVDIDAQGKLPLLKTGFTEGRLLLYDLERNNDLKVRRPVITGIASLKPKQRKATIHVTKKHSVGDPSLKESPIVQPINSILTPEPSGAKVDKFDELIKQILSTPPSSDTQRPPAKRTKRKQPDQVADLAGKTDGEVPPVQSKEGAPEILVVNKADDLNEISNTISPGGSVTVEPSKQPPVSDDDQKYIKIFQRLFRSFRQQAFECFGPRYEAIMTQAEHQVRLLSPEFDMENLTGETVPLMLDIMDDMINRAPFLKRSKLRDAAQVLVADLYNKHYELLEQHNAIDKVEQNYFQLKK